MNITEPEYEEVVQSLPQPPPGQPQPQPSQSVPGTSAAGVGPSPESQQSPFPGRKARKVDAIGTQARHCQGKQMLNP